MARRGFDPSDLIGIIAKIWFGFFIIYIIYKIMVTSSIESLILLAFFSLFFIAGGYLIINELSKISEIIS
jgi:uncharacterized membrane protein